MMADKFIVKIIGILFEPKSRKILIGKKKGDKEYSFLQGDLNYKAELDKNLKKIAKEKTGYKIHNLGAVYAKNKIRNKKDVLELYFLCEATEGKEKKGNNIQELIWVKPSEIEKRLKQKFPARLKEYILGLE
jgi:ADP-ribose pyrophosphatase YjhB (NUDIX family)